MVVDIDSTSIEARRRSRYDSFSALFGNRNTWPERTWPEPVIGVGDSVAVTIWEAS
jgi:hypothetical protein